MAAVALGLLAILPSGAPPSGILAFGLAGLGCSALLPLTISFGQRELVAVGASLAGLLIAFYQMGYGLAAFGVGPLEEHAGMSLTTIYGAAAIVALAMGAAVVRGRPVAREPVVMPVPSLERRRSQFPAGPSRRDADVVGEQGRHRHRR